MKTTIEKFKEDYYIDIIEKLLKMNNGYITSKMLDDFDIHRMYLNKLWKNGRLEKVGKGIYIEADKLIDNYYVFNLRMPKIIYSHMTALYFHGLSIKAPEGIYDITVVNSYNNVNLKQHNVFYVKNDNYELGLTYVITPLGNKVRAYDIERCICDIIKSKNRMDSEHVKYSVKKYLKSKNKDLVKLSLYASKLNIKNEVMSYLEVLYE